MMAVIDMEIKVWGILKAESERSEEELGKIRDDLEIKKTIV